jgi:hypothetical protein
LRVLVNDRQQVDPTPLLSREPDPSQRQPWLHGSCSARSIQRPTSGSFDRERGGVHGDLDAVLVEEAREPPDAGPAAVLVHRLHREIAELVRHRVRDLRHALVARVAVLLRRLGPSS